MRNHDTVETQTAYPGVDMCSYDVDNLVKDVPCHERARSAHFAISCSARRNVGRVE